MQLQGYKGNTPEQIKESEVVEGNEQGKVAKVYTAEGVPGQTEGRG